MKKINIITTLALASLSVCAFSVSNQKPLQAKAYDTTAVDCELGGVSIVAGYNNVTNYLLFNIKDSDYQFDYNRGNDFPVHYDAGMTLMNFTSICNFFNTCKLNDVTMKLYERPTYLVYRANPNTIAIEATKELANLKEGDTLTIPTGTTFPSYGLLTGGSNNLYTTTKELVYRYTDGSFRKEINVSEVSTEITNLKTVAGYNTAQRFLLATLSTNDYNDVIENNKNDYNLSRAVNSFKDFSNFGYKMETNGVAMNLESRNIYLNYYGNIGTIGIEFTSNYNALKNLDTITIPAGTTFPSYEILKDNGSTVYKTDKDVTFTFFNSNFHICSSNASTTFEHNEQEHWQKCSICEQIINKANHHFVFDQKEATCLEDGFDQCEYCDECGYVKTEGTLIPATGHDYENAPYLFDEEGHWQTCTHECGECNEKVAHTYASGSKACSVCGYEKNVFFTNITNGYTYNGVNEFQPDSEVTVIANTPEDGYKFAGWYKDGQLISETSTYTFTINEDISLEAKYEVDNTDYGEPDILNGEGENNDKDDKKGCKGSIVSCSAVISIISLLSIGFSMKKKK